MLCLLAALFHVILRCTRADDAQSYAIPDSWGLWTKWANLKPVSGYNSNTFSIGRCVSVNGTKLVHQGCAYGSNEEFRLEKVSEDTRRLGASTGQQVCMPCHAGGFLSKAMAGAHVWMGGWDVAMTGVLCAFACSSSSPLFEAAA